MSSLSWWVFSDTGSFWLTERKEKWLEKVSTRWKPEESFLFKLSKEEKFSFRWLLVFTIELLILDYCLVISWDVAMQWGLKFLEWCLSKRKLTTCCLGRDNIQRWCWLLILSKWKWIRMRLAIALTFHDGNVQRVPVIQRTSLLCIFFSSLRGWYNSTPLK